VGCLPDGAHLGPISKAVFAEAGTSLVFCPVLRPHLIPKELEMVV